MAEVLEEIESKYRIHHKEVTESEARQALNRHRPLVATFGLMGRENSSDGSLDEWDHFTANSTNKFGRIMTKTELRIMTKTDVQVPCSMPRKLGGHAVVLLEAGPGYLKFQNSWGKNWGKDGKFCIRDSSVLRNMKFLDVFWYVSDLKQSEKNACEAQSRTNLDNLKRDYPALAKLWR